MKSFLLKTPNDGRPYDKRNFIGRNDEGTYSFHSYITACCDFKNGLSSFRGGVSASSHLFIPPTKQF